MFCGEIGKALGGDGADGVVDDEGGEGRGRVINAEAFALGAFGHRGGIGSEGCEEGTTDAEFFDLADGFLEKMAENFDADIFGEIILADAMKDVSPFILQVEFVDVFIFGEEAPVIAGGEVEIGMAFVDGVKGIEEVSPAWISDAFERPDGFPSGLDQLGGE